MTEELKKKVGQRTHLSADAAEQLKELNLLLDVHYLCVELLEVDVH